MDSKVVKIIQDRAEKILQQGFAADPMFKHFTVTAAGGKIGEIDTTLKFLFLDTTAKPKSVFTGDRNEDSVRMGLAPAGTEVTYAGKDYILINARQKKYLAQDKSNGKNYLISFAGCRLINRESSPAS